MGTKRQCLLIAEEYNKVIVNKKHLLYAAVCCSMLLFSAFNLKAADTTKHKRIKVLPVPAFGYSPETKTYVGAVALFTIDLYNDSATRTSNFKLEFNYTWNKQVIAEAGWNYFFREEQWFTKGLLHYSKFPDRYYGTGSDTKQVDELLYSSNRFIGDVHVLKKIARHLFTGPGVKVISFSNVTPSAQYPELANNTSTSIGYSAVYDSRSNILNPKSGWYLNINPSYTFYQQEYTKLIADARYYTTWKDRYTFATRFYNEYNFGNPPFFDYAQIGGDALVRGYYKGRFRDKKITTLQTELRGILIWRTGLAVFGGLTSLYDNISDAQLAAIKYNYGAGIRFLIDRKEDINLRLDYALGTDGNSGFYISFGSSF